MPASLGARPLPMRFGPGVSPMATLHLRLRSPAYSALRILPQRSAPGVPAATELAGRWSAIRINDTMGPHPAFTLPPSSSTSMEQRYDEAVEVGQATIEVYPKYPSTCAALAGVWLATCRRCDPPRQYGDCVADYTKRTSFRNIFSSRLLGLTLRLVARARVLFLLDQFELPTPTSWPC